MNIKDRLSGDEQIVVTGLAIAYTSRIESPDGHYQVHAISLGPKLIQADSLPEALVDQMEKIIIEHECQK